MPPAAPAPARPIEPSPSEESFEEAPVEAPSTVRSRIASRARERVEEPVPTERSARRQMGADYGYVVKDLRRIVVLATAIIVAIIVLSFFLP